MWRCRTQKNGENNEKREHARNPYVGTPCYMTSTIRIVQRFSRLIGTNHRNVPLSVYRHANGQVRYVTASIIESTFGMAAAAHVYKLDPVKDCEHLRKWSSHSLRVGACVTLPCMGGFTDSQIKLLLRWQSDDFFDYLRNITGLAFKQCHALHDLFHYAKLCLIVSRTIPDLVPGMYFFFLDFLFFPIYCT
jgi:hypothetical protein